MLSLLNLGTWTRSSVSHSGLLRFDGITRLKVNLNRLKNYFWVTGILRKTLLTPLTKLLISLGIGLGHLTLLNAQFMWDFLGLDLLASWLPIKFLSLLHVVIMRLWFEPFRSIHKDVLPLFQQSDLIHKFQCCCNVTYIGRTFQRLEVRVKQHVHRDICNRTTSGHQNCSILPSVSIWML